MADRKPIGRPRKYSPDQLRDKGAPKLNVRFDPNLYRHVHSRPEGPRAYLERVVTEDMAREAGAGQVGQESAKSTPEEQAIHPVLLKGKSQIQDLGDVGPLRDRIYNEVQVPLQPLERGDKETEASLEDCSL